MRRLWRPSRWLIAILAALAAGCHGEPDPPKTAAPSFGDISLKVGALDQVAILAGVAPQRGEWEASRGGSISIREQALGLDSVAAVDVILFPGERLGDLVDGDVLAVIPNAFVMPPRPAESEDEHEAGHQTKAPRPGVDETFQYMDFVPAFREQVSRYGKERFALPCGGSALVLVFRRDAFESDSNRAAARQAGLTLPPVTWNQLDALARFFEGRDWDGDGKPDHGIAVALGPEIGGVGDMVFLARSASLGQHRDHYSFLFDSDEFTPRINTSPFVEAMAGLVAWKAWGPPGMDRFDSAAARQAFRTGKVAMLIDQAERASDWSHGKPVNVARLPGSERVYEPIRKEWVTASPPNAASYLPHGGGWLIGINSRLSGTQLEAALDFAKYLASPENTNRICSERAFPLLPVRESQLDQGLPDPNSAPDVDSRMWSNAVRQTLTADRVVPGLRIPGADGYLGDLSKGRLAALGGEAPEKALQAVAKAWTDRTSAHGRQRQLWHYRRSLNNLVTLPQPPERGK